MHLLFLALVAAATSTGDPKPQAELAPSIAAPPRAINPFAGHRLDGSGYLIPARRWQVGLTETSYGLFDGLSVGTSPYPWLVAPVLQGFSANVSLKTGLRTAHVAVSLEARYLYLNVQQVEDARSSLTENRVSGSVVPLTAAVSWRLDDIQTYSFAARYVLSIADGTQSRQSQEVVEGAAITDALHMIFSARWRVTKIFGLYGRGYFEPWNRALQVEGEGGPSERTRVRFRASVDTTEDTGLRWSALAGAHLIFGNVNVRLGVGYGSYFAPAVGLVVPNESLYPDLDIYVRL